MSRQRKEIIIVRQKIIDLTLKIENNMLTPSDFQRPVYVKVMTHEDS